MDESVFESNFEKSNHLILADEKSAEIKLQRLFIFEMAKEYYGFHAEFLKEVIALATIFFIPSVPDYVLGLINLRGESIAIIDLKKNFSLEDTHDEIKNIEKKIIVVEVNKIIFGIIVDDIIDIFSIPEEEICYISTPDPNDNIIATMEYNKTNVTLFDIKEVLNQMTQDMI